MHMSMLNDSGQKQLECTYGPAATALGTSQTYYFWHRTVPKARQTYLLAGAYSPLAQSGNLALNECPANAAAARAFQAKSWDATFIDPSAGVRWACRGGTQRGNAPGESLFVQQGLRPGGSAVFSFNETQKEVTMEVNGATLRSQWEYVDGSPTSIVFTHLRRGNFRGRPVTISTTWFHNRRDSSLREVVKVQTHVPGASPLDTLYSDWTLACTSA